MSFTDFNLTTVCYAPAVCSGEFGTKQRDQYPRECALPLGKNLYTLQTGRELEALPPEVLSELNSTGLHVQR
jgi:hypothetical protein